jgi:multicomponent Na+:H+ antiporter subunit C
MDAILALLAGLLLAAAIYMMLSRALIRLILGVVLLGNGVNLLILVGGRLTRAVPPIIPQVHGAPIEAVANPLPQALILTAIVIGFALFAFLIVLAFRAYQSLEADNTDHMRLAEPEQQPQPPLEY